MNFNIKHKISEDKYGKQVKHYSIQIEYDNKKIDVYICKICIGIVFHNFVDSNIFPYENGYIILNSKKIYMSEEDAYSFFEMAWEILRGDVIE